jgi:hypothetical protein
MKVTADKVVCVGLKENKSVDVTGTGCRAIDPIKTALSHANRTSHTFRALKGRDNHLYAYASWNYRVVRVAAHQVDDNTMRVAYTRVEYGGP